MFAPGEIVYGYVTRMGKSKYAVSIYRDENVNILIHFTTSQPRAGVPIEQVHHGAIYKDGECRSYVFEAKREIGINPSTGARFISLYKLLWRLIMGSSRIVSRNYAKCL